MKLNNIINNYYDNNASKLRNMVNMILFKLKFEVNKDDFYSLANEIFVDVVKRYDSSQDFDNFLYSCLINKFKTEMTKRNRQKRKGDKEAISLYSEINEDNCMVIDVIPDNYILDEYVLEKVNPSKKFTDNTEKFLELLSPLQKKIAILIADGYEKKDICKELNITEKQFLNSFNRICSNKNISLLANM